MDAKGNYTDRRGTLLMLGTRVRMVRDEFLSGAVGSGRVASLPPEGNDYNGFPLVEFDHDGRKRHVPDSALLVDDSSYVELVNRYGTFRTTPRLLDSAIARYLPASVGELRETYRKHCKLTVNGHDYGDVESASELLIMIAHVEGP